MIEPYEPEQLAIVRAEIEAAHSLCDCGDNAPH